MVSERGFLNCNMVEAPLFMKNKEWYYFDEKEFKYKLTEKAPSEAVQSYKEFYKEIYEVNND